MKLIISLLIVSLLALRTLRPVNTQAPQIIYPAETINGTTPLYFGLMQSFGEGFNSSGVIGGVEVALDQINNDSTMLPGYTLHYTLLDSQCERTVALNSFFKCVLSDKTVVAWLGSGCSPATEPTAEVSHYFNLTQISCDTSSSTMANRDRFKYYFQILLNDDNLANGYYGIIKTYGWKRVAIIVQNEDLFTFTMNILKEMLDMDDIDYTETSFETDEGVDGLDGSRLFDPEARIFILSMYQEYAEDVLCKAYHNDMRYPTHLFIPLTWYKLNEGDRCPLEYRKSVLPYVIGPLQFEWIKNYETVADTGIDGHQFNTSYFDRLKSSPLGITNNNYSSNCYDATWAMAYAINETVKDLRDNVTLRMQAAEEQGIPNDDHFGLENFTYINNIIAETMFRHLKGTNFTGITGPLSFDSSGIRSGGKLKVRQYRYSPDLKRLEFVTIGRIGDDATLEYEDGFSNDNVWPDGIPYDGVPIEEEVTVAVPVTVIFSILATAGVVFVVVCLVFNFVFRKKELLLSSRPYLNYIIGIGALMLYIDVYLSVMPTTERGTASVLCNMTPLLASIGYSLCFGVILAKMSLTVHYIVKKKLPTRKSRVQEWHLALVVLVLVALDLFIMIVYVAAEGDNLSAERVRNRENPMEEKGRRDIIHEYFFYTCTLYAARDISLGILYGYKAILHSVCLFFGFHFLLSKPSRVITDEDKYIAAACYATFIIPVITLLSSYVLVEYVNLNAVLFGLGLLIATTCILLLVFVPKMVELLQNLRSKSEHQQFLQSSSWE